MKWDYLVLSDLEMLKQAGSTNVAEDVVDTAWITRALKKFGQEGWEHYFIEGEFEKYYFRRPIEGGERKTD